jgi:hypothetical protein
MKWEETERPDKGNETIASIGDGVFGQMFLRRRMLSLETDSFSERTVRKSSAACYALKS